MDWIGRYEVVERIGSGGFATVYRVRDSVLDSEVAAKVLADNWCHDAEIRDRFIREAQLLRRIDSDRVVTVHDIGELPSGQPYFVMALADRGTLEDRLADVETPAVADVRAIGERVIECIGTVHHHDLIHRDIKPSNLLIASSRSSSVGAAGSELLDPFERLVLGDFGLAKDIALQQTGLTITAGTGGYAAPEQMTPGGSPDRRTDLYAATGVMYRVISGTVPPGYDLGSQAVPFDDSQWWMSGALGGFFRRGMAFDQRARHDSIDTWHAELIAALVPYDGGTVIAPPSASVPAAPGTQSSGRSVQGFHQGPDTPPPSYQPPPAPSSAPPGHPSGPPSGPSGPPSGPPPGPYTQPMSGDPSPPHGAGPVSYRTSPYTPPPQAPPPQALPPQASPYAHGPGQVPGGVGRPPAMAGRNQTVARKPSRRWLPVGLVVLFLVVALGAYSFLVGGGPIQGSDTIVAGTSENYTASIDGAVSYVWTKPDGATEPGAQLTVDGVVPGTVSFSVVGLDAGGQEVGDGDKTVTITPAQDGPKITGADEIRVDEPVTYGYEAPTGYSASQPEWLDPGTGQWIAGESYTLKGIVPGPIRVALRVTRDDGTRVGTVKVVEIVG